MSNYDSIKDEQMVLYGETIHVYASVKPADRLVWLVLYNYGDVFGRSPEEKIMLVVGCAPGAGNVFRRITQKETGATGKRIANLSWRLDAPDVIKFQRGVQAFWDKELPAQIKSSREYAIQAIQAGLAAIDPTLPRQANLETTTSVAELQARLARLRHACSFFDHSLPDQLLHQPHGTCTFIDQEKLRAYENLGFLAYFPKPALMLEEQRTYFRPGEPGEPDRFWKTANTDTRKLNPLQIKNAKIPSNALQQILVEIASMEQAAVDTKKITAPGQYTSSGMFNKVCCYGFRGDTRAPSAIQTAGGFFSGITRTDQYIYRSGKPKLTLDVKYADALNKGGNLPDDLVNLLKPLFATMKTGSAYQAVKPKVKNIGQQDKWWMIEYVPITDALPMRFLIFKEEIEYHEPGGDKVYGLRVYDEMIELTTQTPVYILAKDLDESLGKLPKHLDDQGKPLQDNSALAGKTGLDDYLKSIKTFYLRVQPYTMKETFKAFLSATRSMAICKCYGNLHSDVNGEGFIYAVRCMGGLELPSYDPDFKREDSVPDRIHAISYLLNYFEQEVCVPGTIWWEDVVGFRINRTNVQGQFLAGPVFLHADLNNTVDPKNPARSDPEGFQALFALLSGKSQGPGATIEPSYIADSGFDFIPNAVILPKTSDPSEPDPQVLTGGRYGF